MATDTKTRIAIAALSLSAAAFVGRAVHDLLIGLAGSPDWRGQGFLHGPSKALNSMVDALVRYASDFSPFDGRQSPSVMFKKNYAALIPLLLFRSSPRAVIWRIRSVIIFAINRVGFAWRNTHVCKKVFKRPPSVANKDPASAIVRIVIARLLFAPPMHHVPGVVLLCVSSAISVARLPVQKIRRACAFALQASARLCVAVWEFVGTDRNACPAVAKTIPVQNLADIWSARSYRKTAKPMPYAINKSWHFVTLKWFTVIGAWQSAVNSFSGATLAKQPNFIGEVA